VHVDGVVHEALLLHGHRQLLHLVLPVYQGLRCTLPIQLSEMSYLL
jgi:hypothetical protein